MRTYARFFVLLLLAAGCAIPTASAAKPDVILIVVDDLGWADLACYGSDLHETPAVDGLAGNGLRFTNAYAPAPVCSPTRAALMSGQHPARLHMTIWREASTNPPRGRKVIPPVTVADLPWNVYTIAEQLRAGGYVTAHIGKWHLGDAAHYPQTQGFDFEVGGTHWGCPATFFYPYRGPAHGEYRYIPGLGLGDKGDYLTDRLTDEAVRWIDAVDRQPLFLYMAYYTVHTPIEGKPELVRHFADKVKPGMRHSNPDYAAMVCSMDQNVSRILNALRQHRGNRQTLIILTSDNGGFINSWGRFGAVTNNAPLRSGKGSLYEGGIRVPLIMSLPGVTAAGSTCSEPVTLTDLYPTILDAAGLPVNLPQSGTNQSGTLDGISLMPLLKHPDDHLSRKTLYWHYPHYYPTTTPVSAIRSGDWKLLEYLEDGSTELYNLRDDLSEQKNLAGTHPERTDRLLKELTSWRESIDAQMPTPNPKFAKPKPPARQ